MLGVVLLGVRLPIQQALEELKKEALSATESARGFNGMATAIVIARLKGPAC